MIVGKRQITKEDTGERVRLSALNMYSTPPEEQVSLTEFEDFAFDRLRLLSTIDMARAKGMKGEQLADTIRKAQKQYMPLSQPGLRKDYFSHFILRLAYCRTEDLRRWFLQNETELFKWRFTHNPPEDMNHWLASNGLRYEAISREERDALRDKLVEMSKCRREEFSEHQEYYKVRFEEVVDLIRQRRVYLRAGYAYVPQSDLVSIVATRVRAFLSKQLSMHARAWPALREEEAERLSTFLEQLATSYVGGDDYADGAGKSGVKVGPADLPALSRRSMPLCQSNMYNKLVETHHLKHKARNQLGLFLKGVGLTVEESYAVWRGNFIKDPAMTAEKWQKEYAYGIRYNYGLEGKRTNWSPHSCMKIISETGSNPAAGEHHGCPFKTFDEQQLRAQLQQMSVGGSDIHFILDKVKGQHFQVACGKYFEAKHKGSALIETELGGITHPNQFFDESMKFHGSADGTVEAKGTGAPSAAASTSAPHAESADAPMPEAVPVA